MNPSASMPILQIVESDESSGLCDCCGNVTRCVWWTVDHTEHDPTIDLCVGPWGEAATPVDRFFVSLLYRHDHEGSPAVMVVDASERLRNRTSLAASALRRDEVIGTPLAAQVFVLVDAVLLQDRRLWYQAPTEEDE